MSTFEVRACTSADRAAQARLFNACFKKGIDARGLAWRYDEGPHGSSLSFAQWSAEAGAFVSGYACSPRRAIPAGDESRAALVGETGDVMTHPDWRKRGLFSALDRAAMEAARAAGWPLVFGLPNRRSAHIFLELGWESVGTLRPWTFVLRARDAMQSERAKGGRLRGLLPWTDLPAARAARARLRAAAAQGGLRVESLTAFPPEVEALSRAVEPRFALMVRRDADYLDWRFLRAPSGLFRAQGLFDGERLAAYAVVQVPRPGESGGYLVDVLGRDDAAVDAAIEAGIGHLAASGAAYVTATAIDGSWWSARLASSGFRPPTRENHLTVIVHVLDAAHPLSAAARDPARWYLTDGDRDDETMG